MIVTTQNGVSFYQFQHLAQFSRIRHGIFSRSGGSSDHPFQSLNVSFGLGDDDKNVEQNRQRVAECIDGQDFVYLRQIHGQDIVVLSQTKGNAGPEVFKQPLIGDAVVTDIPDKFLVIQAADCQSVLLCDPVGMAVANIHSGWRGTIKNIIGRTVQTMQTFIGSNPTDIRAGIGPSLGPCCAEFVNYKKEIPKAFWQYKDDNDFFDFWSVSYDQLVAAGVSTKHIESSRICTKCNTDLFFSYRAEGITGRFAAVIGFGQTNDSGSEA